MEKYKFDENNDLWYELGENGMYYPMIKVEDNLNVGKYGKLAMEHMKRNSVRYKTFGVMGMFPRIFNNIDEEVYNIINNIMNKKLKEEPIQDNWNVVEIEKHKKMLYREAEEIALQEIVYKDHFSNIDMEKVFI
ncbi:TnpV protein [uncultured Tyzzerella sp.]|uniref:TnpV protein n=1 Tax=uncultured Tyzzerella sp. TaxID=2321398 RepID=UPI002942243E|nr:TnpV protein [uncultured Tyzzerella sp.]